MIAPHDLEAMPGRPCPGCQPHPEPFRTAHEYLVTASRSAGATVCGHYHAEHCSDDDQDARALVARLAAEHGYAELRRRDDAGRYELSSSTSRPESTTTAPCCAELPEGTPFHWNPIAGARCSACGDPWTYWTTPRTTV